METWRCDAVTKKASITLLWNVGRYLSAQLNKSHLDLGYTVVSSRGHCILSNWWRKSFGSQQHFLEIWTFICGERKNNLNLFKDSFFKSKYIQHLSLHKMLLERRQVIFAVFLTEGFKLEIRKTFFRNGLYMCPSSEYESSRCLNILSTLLFATLLQEKKNVLFLSSLFLRHSL